MVSAVSNAVILSQRPDNYGPRVEYRFKCDSCGYVRQGSPSVFIFNSPGTTTLGSVRCEGCGATKTPVFYRS